MEFNLLPLERPNSMQYNPIALWKANILIEYKPIARRKAKTMFTL